MLPVGVILDAFPDVISMILPSEWSDKEFPKKRKFNIMINCTVGLPKIYWVSMFISCAEVLQLNILIYDFLSFAKMWMTFHNASSRMVCHQCGFFRVASNDMIGCFWSHTGCIWMVYHQCAFFHVSSMHLSLSTCIHTGSSWRVYHQCGFFHVASNDLM